MTTRRTDAGADQTPAATRQRAAPDHARPPRRPRTGTPTRSPRPAGQAFVLDTSVLLSDPGGVPPLRRARGGAAARGHLRAGGQAAPSRARLVRPAVAAHARRPAGQARPAGPAAAGQRRGRHAAGGAEPRRPRACCRPASATTPTTPGSSPWRSAWPRRAATSRWSARTCRCGSRPPRSAWRADEYRHGQASDPTWTGMAELELAEDEVKPALRRRGARPATAAAEPALPHRPGAALGARLGAGPGAARTRRCGWSAATGRRSACAAARPSSASRWTCCWTSRSASCRWAAGPAPASRRWRCAPGWRR